MSSALGETAERRERLRLESANRGLDGVLVFAWRRRALTWLTGYSPGFLSNYAALWIPSKGEAVLGIRFAFDRQRAEAASGLRVLGGVEPHALLAPAVRCIGMVTGDLVIDERPSWLDLEFARMGIETVDLTPVIDRWRAIKTAGEVDALRVAARLSAAALAEAAPATRLGEPDFALAARVEYCARKAGAERALCLIGVGDGAAVTEPTGAAIASGDPVALELTLYLDGVCVQANRTLLPGSPKPHQRAAVEACRKVRRIVVNALRPGRSVADVVAAGERALEQRGLLDALQYDFGHGIGVDTPEHPRLIRGTDEIVEEGMVATVHVGIRRRGGETAFIGGPVVVDASGPEELVEESAWTSS